ncbi:serine/threonine protein kinase [Reticulomyxa filosa]|uniref:Serine/threonine protein kinase n=1 Tax=Reticulomyxa filosa TaxID=46433 RepID=X6MLZ1_RETFI|nr:serine/threonine protein kinase [Reticulomyxa filosa]|eukprot:ETO14105.1 serine/threonine protein kinase [Reticulomyxa filosa]
MTPPFFFFLKKCPLKKKNLYMIFLFWLDIHKVCKVMHLDLKPNNIMINTYKVAKVNSSDGYTLIKLVNPRVTLIDFSVSAKMERETDLDDHVCRGYYGTRRYRAPEMIFGGTWNRSIDTFALALIVLECIQLSPLFENKYYDQDGGRFEQLKDSKGRKLYEPREVIDYLMRMTKACLGKPSHQFVTCVEKQFQSLLKDTATIPEFSEYQTKKKSLFHKHMRNLSSSWSSSSLVFKDETNKFGQDLIGNPYYTPTLYGYGYGHMRMFRPTLSQIHQSHLFVWPKDVVVGSYFHVYQPFIHHKMIFDSDITRLDQIKLAVHHMLRWNPADRWTPELLLQTYFQHDKDYLLSCLFTQQQFSDLLANGFTDHFINDWHDPTSSSHKFTAATTTTATAVDGNKKEPSMISLNTCIGRIENKKKKTGSQNEKNQTLITHSPSTIKATKNATVTTQTLTTTSVLDKSQAGAQQVTHSGLFHVTLNKMTFKPTPVAITSHTTAGQSK